MVPDMKYMARLDLLNLIITLSIQQDIGKWKLAPVQADYLLDILLSSQHLSLPSLLLGQIHRDPLHWTLNQRSSRKRAKTSPTWGRHAVSHLVVQALPFVLTILNSRHHYLGASIRISWSDTSGPIIIDSSIAPSLPQLTFCSSMNDACNIHQATLARLHVALPAINTLAQ